MITHASGATAADHPSELRIVVGVDGSDNSTRALDFAAHEAALRGALRHVVSAFEDTPYGTSWTRVQQGLDQVSAGAIVDESLAYVQEIKPAIVSKGEIRDGLAGRVLVETASDATLLVVGSRGRGQVASLLVGSVSEYCIHHADSSVTVVR
jgi:nucleotide-binding universal stress UspA family protein